MDRQIQNVWRVGEPMRFPLPLSAGTPTQPPVIPHKFAAKRRGLERGRPARLCALGNRISLVGTPRRVGEHLPTRFGVPFKLVRFYYTQRRAGRPRSSPSPLRGELYVV
jgi:hypothetical protein